MDLLHLLNKNHFLFKSCKGLVLKKQVSFHSYFSILHYTDLPVNCFYRWFLPVNRWSGKFSKFTTLVEPPTMALRWTLFCLHCSAAESCQCCKLRTICPGLLHDLQGFRVKEGLSLVACFSAPLHRGKHAT